METQKIKVGIVGVSGYSGRELLRILLDHPEAEVVYVSANTTTGPVADIWPEFAGKTELVCGQYDVNEAANADLVFLATPHKVSMKLAPALLERGRRVIDISGDFRLSSPQEYAKWYKAEEHAAPELLHDAVYGLPEIYAGQIKDAKLVANPGCYPTVSILAVAPLAGQGIESIHIDAKSGTSGAGIRQAERLIDEMKDNFKAYKILKHQHSPEIVEQLSRLAKRPLPIAFVPHLLPFERGIFATVYITLQGSLSAGDAQQLFKDFYAEAPFIDVVDPEVELELKTVVGTNNLQIHVAAEPDQNLLVITATLDNLIKGASGQAVQNFNLMYGFDETIGLIDEKD
jgi:N-acetyl-gamma-glutamyl-phosphate reductase